MITIRLYGRGTDRGIGTITEEQYEYWNENSDWLADAVNGDFDYEEQDVPEAARLSHEYYNEYEDIAFETGCDEDACYIQITDSEDNELYNSSLPDFLTLVHGDDDSYYEATEEIDEMYLMNSCIEPGYYLYWQHGGKGTYFNGTISIADNEVFDPKLLKFNSIDFNTQSMITQVMYNGELLDNDGDSIDGKWTEYEVCRIGE